MSSEWLMHWTAGHPNGMTRHPDGWQGTKIFDLQTVQNLLETLLNSGIPDKKHLYKEVILSNRIWPITN
jgi:DNA primase